MTTAKIAISILMMIGEATPWGFAQSRPRAPDLHYCRYSDQVYNSDDSLMRQKAPTHFRLMTSRYVQIVEAARGRDCTGTAAVAFNGHDYTQAGKSDDPGL